LQLKMGQLVPLRRGKLSAAVAVAWPGAPADLVAAAVEYGMLHLGGGKYRAKVMDLSGGGVGAAGQEEEEEEEEEAVVRGEKKSKKNEKQKKKQGSEDDGDDDNSSSSSDDDDEEEEEEAAEEEEERGIGEREVTEEEQRRVTKKQRLAPPPLTAGVPSALTLEDGAGEEATATATNDGGETTVTVSEYTAVPRSPSSAKWEGRVGVEFRGAASAGINPTPDGVSIPASTAIATVAPSDLRVCVPWWRDVDAADSRAVGRWGEALVYQYLLQRYPGWRVTWLNEKEESSSFYDIKLESPPPPPQQQQQKSGRARGRGGGIDGGGDGRASPQQTVFVEVKTTRWADRNAFEMSAWEWDFAQRPGVGSAYHVYRVYSAGDPARVRITVVRDPARLVREHAVSMCLAI
jgi:hypothetical protein